jgi:hypothetical protein
VAVSFNVNMSINGGNRRGAFDGGNVYKDRGTLNSGMYSNQSSGEQIGEFNLRKIVNLGLAFNTAQKANEIAGAWTQNRLRQRRIDTGMTFAKYGIGLAINPVVGGVYMASDLGYRAIMYQIEKERGNIRADYYRRLSGNATYSGSRYRGDYL